MPADTAGQLGLIIAMDARFPRSARVRTRADYSRIFDGGRRVSHPLLSLHWCDDGQPPRLGLAVSRKVDPNAVGRNRIKRALREQFRALRPRIASGSYVVVARQSAAIAPGRDVRAAFVTLLQRAGALPPSDADGTMPVAERVSNPSEPILSPPLMPSLRTG